MPEIYCIFDKKHSHIQRQLTDTATITTETVPTPQVATPGFDIPAFVNVEVE